MSEATGKGGPNTPQWSCGFAEAIGMADSPIPVPVKIREDLHYVEGAGGGFFNDEGQLLIGMPGGFVRPSDRVHISERLGEMRDHLLGKFGPGLIEVDEETAAELLAIGQRPRGADQPSE